MADDDSPTKSARGERLHLLSGLALVAFVVVHIAVQASALGGASRYDAVAGAVARTPGVELLELLLVGVPLAIHATSGLLRMRRTPADGAAERWGDRRLRLAQHGTALVLLVFLVAHVWELRVARLTLGIEDRALYTLLSGKLSSTWAGIPGRAILYLVAVFAGGVHVANGLRAAVATRDKGSDPGHRKGFGGLTPPNSRRIRVATALLGATLALVGGATVIGLATGTRLLPGADDDSGRTTQVSPCGSAVQPAPPPFQIPKPSPAPSR